MSNSIFDLIIEELDIPDSAYQAAVSRYHNLGEWLQRKESACLEYKPSIHPQGSFNLGTVVRPVNPKEEYDLDLTCKFHDKMSKGTTTQQAVKQLLGSEIESYRIAMKIQKAKEEKRRCWRLEYSDQLSFHMDVVPCIPEDEPQRKILKQSVFNSGASEDFAREVSELAISITDTKHPGYSRISSDWNINNTEGYAVWFRNRMKQATLFLQERARKFNAASIEKLPYYQWKTPLQRCIQILKRHRDQLFINNKERAPASIIITTLAAHAYQGEADIGSSLRDILAGMEKFINTRSPRVPNPADPREDFADRWSLEDCRHLELEKNFWFWLAQAKADFNKLTSMKDPVYLIEQTKQSMGVDVNAARLKETLSFDSLISVAPSQKVYSIKKEAVARPWQE